MKLRPGVTNRNDSLEPALSAMARHVRSGSSLHAALRAAHERHRSDLVEEILHLLDRGSSLRSACDSVLTSTGRRSSAQILVLNVLALSADSGGDVSSNLDAVVESLRDQRIVRDERLANAATALVSTRVLTWLPVVCAGYLVLDDESIRRVLLGSPIGWTCLTVGIALNLIGRRWTRSLVNDRRLA